MDLNDLPTANALSSQLYALRALAEDADGSRVIQVLCAERQGEGKSVAYIRDLDFSEAFKAFLDSQIIATVEKLNKIGVFIATPSQKE